MPPEPVRGSPAMVLPRHVALAGLLLVLSLLAAGCGSSKSPEEKWADNICSQVTDWKDTVTQSVDDIRTQIQSPSSGTLDSIKSSVNSIVDASNKLSSGLKSTGAPDTPAGTQAKQQVDSFATQLQSSVQEAKQKAGSVSSSESITTTLSKLASLGPSLQSLATSAQTTLKSVQSSAQALRDGFQKAGSCKPYRTS